MLCSAWKELLLSASRSAIRSAPIWVSCKSTPSVIGASRFEIVGCTSKYACVSSVLIKGSRRSGESSTYKRESLLICSWSITSCLRQVRISAFWLLLPEVNMIWKLKSDSSSIHHTCLAVSALVLMKYSRDRWSVYTLILLVIEVNSGRHRQNASTIAYSSLSYIS